MGTEIYVKPGEVFFGRDAIVRTLLGSCVSIIVWQPEARVGGMCHFVLPARGGRAGDAPDGSFAPEAVRLLLQGMDAHRTAPHAYRFHLYGGGNMFPEFNVVSGRPVGTQNAAAARALVRQFGGQIVTEDLGDNVYRNIQFNTATGEITVRRTVVGSGLR